MLPVRILAASTVALISNIGIAQYAEEQGVLEHTDTSFLSRCAFLAGALFSLLAFMWPNCKPAKVQGFFLAWPIIAAGITFIYITQEPILIVFPILAALVGLCRSIRESSGPIGVAPMFMPPALATIVLTFFLASDQFFDDIKSTSKMDPSAMPDGYLSAHKSSMARHPFLLAAIVMGVASVTILSVIEERNASNIVILQQQQQQQQQKQRMQSY